MSAHVGDAGVHNLKPKHKGGALTIFFSVISLAASFIGSMLVIERENQEGSLGVATDNVDSLVSLFGMLVVIISFTFGALSILIALFRLRHFKVNKKALVNVVGIALAAWAIIVAYKVLQQVT